MSGPTINERIKENFGSNGLKNYTELKNYLQDKDINEVLKEIEEKDAINERSEDVTEEKKELF